MMRAPHELTHHKRRLKGAGQRDGASIANLILTEIQDRDRATGLVKYQAVVTKPRRPSAEQMSHKVIAPWRREPRTRMRT